MADAGRNGFASAFENLGLGSLVGRSLDNVIAALNDALCPAGADRESVAAREAAGDALQEMFSDVISGGGDLTRLDTTTAEDMAKVTELMVSSYIYNRWLGDLGHKIEEKSISPEQAVQTERRMKEFVRDAVKLDLSRLDPLRVDWRGSEGKGLIERIYQDAYSVIGGQ